MIFDPNWVDIGTPPHEKGKMKGDNIAARLVDFGAAVLGLLNDLPDNRTGRHVADQLLRAATSGGANYEEARSAQSRRDFVHKVSLAAKELRESLYCLGLIERAKLVPQTATPLLREANELVAILMRSVKTAKTESPQTRSLSTVCIPGSDSLPPAPRPRLSNCSGSNAGNKEPGAGHQSREFKPGTGNIAANRAPVKPD
jgi:four helix bundle protein